MISFWRGFGIQEKIYVLKTINATITKDSIRLSGARKDYTIINPFISEFLKLNISSSNLDTLTDANRSASKKKWTLNDK